MTRASPILRRIDEKRPWTRDRGDAGWRSPRRESMILSVDRRVPQEMASTARRFRPSGDSETLTPDTRPQSARVNTRQIYQNPITAVIWCEHTASLLLAMM